MWGLKRRSAEAKGIRPSCQLLGVTNGHGTVYLNVMRLTSARLIEALPKPHYTGPATAAELDLTSPESITLHELAARLFGEPPTRTQIESVRRAAKTLAGRELVVLGHRVEGKRRHLTVRRPSALERSLTRALADIKELRSGLGEEQPECQECNRPFTPRRRDKRYCSPACRQAAYRRRARYGAGSWWFAYGPRQRRTYRSRG
jgi:hypothetical protein